MCGIAVAMDWPDAEATVRHLISGLHHRGDITDPVVSPSPTTAMGTRRLRIVDGAHAVQPQISYDNRILVSFNGEIYNHLELRRELEALGITFKTHSDTEVLASALSQWGLRALDRLNGMYAFVAIDLRDGQFLAARDPFGVKPLYFMMTDKGFLFCSEMRPLLAAVPVGDVLFLPPGHVLTRTSCARYKSFRVDPTQATNACDPWTLDRLLRAAVRSRTPTDLPFAIMFSGGIDSSLVAHYALQDRAEAPCYFLGGTDAPDYPYVADYAASRDFDLRFVDFEDGVTETRDHIRDVVETIESFEPDLVRNSFCTSLLSKRIHDDGFRVALAGEGADELFCGYPTLEIAFEDSNEVGGFVRDQHIAGMHRNGLQRLDRCGMRHQLEIREPFLDPLVAAYAIELDSTALLRMVDDKPQGKRPLRGLYDLYAGNLPTSIRDRKKVPLNEGSGFDQGWTAAPWMEVANREISNRELIDGTRRFAKFGIKSKEELLYLTILAASMDVERVPHLVGRSRLAFPTTVRHFATLDPYVAAGSC